MLAGLKARHRILRKLINGRGRIFAADWHAHLIERPVQHVDKSLETEIAITQMLFDALQLLAGGRAVHIRKKIEVAQALVSWWMLHDFFHVKKNLIIGRSIIRTGH